MSELTRRRDPDVRQEAWLVYYGDVHVGTIAIRTGHPTTTDPWNWRCGFYPGSNPGECRSGAAGSFDAARSALAAWRAFLANRTDADFQAWRDQRDWTARKYAMWERGERLQSREPSSIMRCPCGEVFDSHCPENTLIHVAHITASKAANGIC